MLSKVRNGTLARTSSVCVSLIPSERTVIFQRMLLPRGQLQIPWDRGSHQPRTGIQQHGRPPYTGIYAFESGTKTFLPPNPVSDAVWCDSRKPSVTYHFKIKLRSSIEKSLIDEPLIGHHMWSWFLTHSHPELKGLHWACKQGTIKAYAYVTKFILFPFVITPPPFLAFQMTFSECPLHSCYSFFSCLIMFQDERHIQKYLKHVYS